MTMSYLGILPFVLYATCVSLAASETFPQDTYVNALQDSHDSTNFDNDGGYNYSPPSNNNYLPPPTPVYGPPAPVYGPPTPVYGPPPAPLYGPPPPTFYKPVPSLPYHANHSWLLDKIKTKINLFTIGKIILKLLIFKKIVKFIGVICLLLFLPKLKDMFKDNTSMEEDGMESKQVETEQDGLEKRIEELNDFVLKSISFYDDKNT